MPYNEELPFKTEDEGKLDESASSIHIKFKDILTISEVEQKLAMLYQETLHHSSIVFDLSNLQWIGYFPAVLLFSWISTLAKKDTNELAVKLPPPSTLAPQVRKILLEYKIIQHLKDFGVSVPYYSALEPPVGVPLSILTSGENLWLHLQDETERLLRTTQFPNTTLMKDTYDVVLFELLDNAFAHAGGALPHYGISIANSSGTSPHYRG